MKSLSARSNTITYSITLLFLLLFSVSFAQESSIEDRLKIEELSQKIKKNNEKIEQLEENLDVLESVESNLLTNSTLDETALTKEIETLKSLPPTESWMIVDNMNRIDRQMARSVKSFRNIVEKYEENTQGNRDIIFFLGNLAEKNIRAVYPEPEFISYTYNSEGSTPKIDETKFINYKQNLSIKFLTEEYGKINKELSEPIANEKKKLESELNQLESDNEESRKTTVELQVGLEGKSAYDRNVIKWGFPIFIFFILAIYLVPLYFVYKRENLDGQRTENLYRMIYGSGLVTEIITVFLLTSTILLLGITDKLAPEILGTLIGGISGYVLGRSFNNSETMKNNINRQNQEQS